MSNSEDEYDRTPSPTPLEQRASITSSGSSDLKKSLLSNVFSFVSREINEFVVNAAGRPESSVVRVVSAPPSERSGRRQGTRERHERQPAPSHSQHDLRPSKRVRRDEYDQYPTVSLRRERVLDVIDHDVCDASELKHLRHSPPPAPAPAKHVRKTSATMPGSLFPRSPTPEDQADTRHVRFASGIISPMPRRRRSVTHREFRDGYLTQETSGADEEAVDDEDEDEESEQEYAEQESHPRNDEDCESPSTDLSSSPHMNSIYPSSHPRPLPSPSPDLAGPSSHFHSVTPFRPPSIRSVKDVVIRVDGDSPSRPRVPGWGDKGKGKASELGTQVIPRSVDKGNGKESAKLLADVSSTLNSTVDPYGKGSINPGSSVTGILHVERSSRHIPEETARRRIQELEEKVKRLEDELARRPLPVVPPPPPPPPPPPTSTLRVTLSSSPRRGSNVNSLLASVRAGLKQTPGIPESSKVIPKNRLPTVPTDKMEAFLNELKTVKLRKVGSRDDLSRSSANTSSEREYSQSSSQGSSLLEDRWMVGQKRKRADGNEAQNALFTSIKRRFPVPSQASTIPASVASTSLTSLLPRPISTTTQLHHCVSVPVMPTEVDVTTPSLCSDNDNEVEDRAPSTPPLPPIQSGTSHISHLNATRRNTPPSVSQEVEVRTVREQPREQEIRNLPDHSLREKQSTSFTNTTGGNIPPSTSKLATPERHASRPLQATDDPFSRRPPSSPMLPDTPRRPRPPARARSAAQTSNRPPVRSRGRRPSGNNEAQSLLFSPPNASTPAPPRQGSRRPAQGSLPQKQRRITLDEELRSADPSYSEEERAMNNEDVRAESPSYSDEERALQNLESGVLIGVGRKNKRLGFLAHGGAGGEPVLMGVGNVEGAVLEEQTIVSEQSADKVEARKGKKTKGKSNAGARRRPKR